jgi:mycothiol system anti-sigma-R factor
MSCGNPHATPCSDVIEHLYEYLDGELSPVEKAKFKEHLDECVPCLRKYGLEDVVKNLVKRSCSERAPEELREKVLLKIRQVKIEYRSE